MWIRSLVAALMVLLAVPPASSEVITIDKDNLPPGESGDGVSFTARWEDGEQISWFESIVEPFFDDNRSLYAGEPNHPDPAATYRFTPEITQPGVYQVFIFYTPHANRGGDAVVKVASNGGYSLHWVDMRQDPEGPFFVTARPFAATGDEYVQISAINGQCSVDGVRFVYDSDNPLTSPVAFGDTTVAVSGVPVAIDVLANDQDEDGGPLVIAGVTQPEHGSVVNNGHEVLYTPDPSYEGVDSFDYEVTDGTYSDTATVIVQVLPDGGVWHEVRAVWLNHYAFDEEARREQTLQAIDQAKLNTVFLAAHELGGNHGWSSISGFQAMLAALKARGLAVHVWVCSRFRDWSDQVDYTNPDETLAQQQWCADWLATYPELDGYHLDNIRYDDDFAPYCTLDLLEGVTDTVAACHEATEAAGRFLTAAVIDPHRKPRRTGEYTPDWFNTWFDDHGGAAPSGWHYHLYPDEESLPQFFRYQQDNPAWILDGIGDAIVPMTYRDSDCYWRWHYHAYESFLETAGGLDRVVAGLGWYQDTFQEQERLLYKIEYGRLNHVHGFSIFELGRDDAEEAPLVQALAQGPFREPAASWLAVAEENGPDAADDTVRTPLGQRVDIQVLANDSDPDGDELTVIRVLQPEHGTVFNHGTHVEYRPPLVWIGADSFTYTISDGRGGLSAARVSVEVVNQLRITESEGSTWVHGILSDDSDTDPSGLKTVDTYELVLAARPDAPVEVTVTVTENAGNLDLLDPGPSVIPIWRDRIRVTFSTNNWNRPKRIVVGQGRLPGTSPVQCTIEHTTASADPYADDLAADDVIATVYPRWSIGPKE